MLVDLLSEVNIRESVILADKAYGTLDIRTHIESQNSAYCIPPKSDVLNPWDCNYCAIRNDMWWSASSRKSSSFDVLPLVRKS